MFDYATAMQKWEEKKARADYQEEEKADKTETANIKGVKVGDVFYESWGYEQTNIDFWQVTALKGKTQIILTAISSKTVRDIGFCSVMVKPIEGAWSTHYSGSQIVRKVQGTPEHPYCKNKHSNLYLTTWDAEHNETSYY